VASKLEAQKIFATSYLQIPPFDHPYHLVKVWSEIGSKFKAPYHVYGGFWMPN